MRTLIADTMAVTVAIPAATPRLDRMQRLCMSYLNLEEREPEMYVRGLTRLSRKLEDEVRLLAREAKIPFKCPGAGDVDAAEVLA